MAGVERFLLDFLVNALWQVSLIAIGAGAAAGALRRGPAWAAHALWSAALVLAALVPLASALREDRRPLPLGEARAAARPSWTDPTFVGAAATAAASPLTPVTPGPGVLSRVARMVPGAYALALLAMAARLGRSWRRTRGLARTRSPTSGDATTWYTS